MVKGEINAGRETERGYDYTRELRKERKRETDARERERRREIERREVERTGEGGGAWEAWMGSGSHGGAGGSHNFVGRLGIKY